MKDQSDMDTPEFDAGDNEASMEDILASIRELIAEDETESVLVLKPQDELVVEDKATLGPTSAPTTAVDQPHIFADLAAPSLAVSEMADLETVDLLAGKTETQTGEYFSSEDFSNQGASGEGVLDLSNAEDETDIRDLLSFVDESTGMDDLSPDDLSTVDLVQNDMEFEQLSVSVNTDAPQIQETSQVEMPNVDLVDLSDDLLVETTQSQASLAGGTDEVDQAMKTDEQSAVLDQIADNAVASLTDSVGGFSALNSDTVKPSALTSNEIATSEDDASLKASNGLVSSVGQEIKFDEGLDLVVNADASDYITTDFGDVADVETKSDAEIQAGEPQLDDEQAVEQSDLSDDFQEDITLRATPDEDIDLVKSLLADLMDEPKAGLESNEFADEAPLNEDMIEDGENETLETEPTISQLLNVDGPPSNLTETSSELTLDDEPMVDFVTGEVIQPLSASEEHSEYITAVEATPNHSILDDVLQQSIQDELTAQEELETLVEEEIEKQAVMEIAEPVNTPIEVEYAISKSGIAPVDAIAHADTARVDGGADGVASSENSNLDAFVAQIETSSDEPSSSPEAKTETETETETDEIDPDIVVLPKVDYAKKLSLVGGAGLAAGALAMTAVHAKDAGQSAKENADSATDDATGTIDEDGPELISAIDVTDDTEDQTSLLNSTSETIEDENMAKTAKSASTLSDPLLDAKSTSASVNAFASLNKAVKDKNASDQAGPAIGDLVQEALRPMLKEWLDKNLKTIVERAVTKEVKRISSGK